jgi:hypothetical protein
LKDRFWSVVAGDDSTPGVDPLEPLATVSYSASYHEPKTASSRQAYLLSWKCHLRGSPVWLWVGKDSGNSARSIGGRGLLGRLSAATRKSILPAGSVARV